MTKKKFDVKIEIMVPAILVNEVLAETAEEAAQLALKGGQPIKDLTYRFNSRRVKSYKVYDANTINIHLEKTI